MASKDELNGAAAESLPPTEEPLHQHQQQQQHEIECTIGVYNTTTMTQPTKNYYFVSRLNQEFFRCAVYDSGDPSTGRLIGVELIISDRIYYVLPPDEKKFWHSHAYEKENLWINEGVIQILQLTELQLSTSYGKFWSSWQWDNGDALPLGMPSAMKSPLYQVVKDELKDDISSDGPNQGVVCDTTVPSVFTETPFESIHGEDVNWEALAVLTSAKANGNQELGELSLGEYRLPVFQHKDSPKPGRKKRSVGEREKHSAKKNKQAIREGRRKYPSVATIPNITDSGGERDTPSSPSVPEVGKVVSVDSGVPLPKCKVCRPVNISFTMAGSDSAKFDFSNVRVNLDDIVNVLSESERKSEIEEDFADVTEMTDSNRSAKRQRNAEETGKEKGDGVGNVAGKVTENQFDFSNVRVNLDDIVNVLSESERKSEIEEDFADVTEMTDSNRSAKRQRNAEETSKEKGDGVGNVAGKVTEKTNEVVSGGTLNPPGDESAEVFQGNFKVGTRSVTVADSAIKNGAVAFAMSQGSILPADRVVVSNLDVRAVNLGMLQHLAAVNAHALRAFELAANICGERNRLIKEKNVLIEERTELKKKCATLEGSGDPKDIADLRELAQKVELAHLNVVASLKREKEDMAAKYEKEISELKSSHHEVVEDLSAKAVVLEDSMKAKLEEICRLKESHKSEISQLTASAAGAIQKKVRELFLLKVAEMRAKKKKSRSNRSSSTKSTAPPAPS